MPPVEYPSFFVGSNQAKVYSIRNVHYIRIEEINSNRIIADQPFYRLANEVVLWLRQFDPRIKQKKTIIYNFKS